MHQQLIKLSLTKPLAIISKLKYFGYTRRTSDSMEKDLVLGLTDGYRKGRQCTTWTDEIRGALMMNWHDILTATQKRMQWRDLIYMATENRK